jgi:hypothetical protein
MCIRRGSCRLPLPRTVLCDVCFDLRARCSTSIHPLPTRALTRKHMSRVITCHVCRPPCFQTATLCWQLARRYAYDACVVLLCVRAYKLQINVRTVHSNNSKQHWIWCTPNPLNPFATRILPSVHPSNHPPHCHAACRRAVRAFPPDTMQPITTGRRCGLSCISRQNVLAPGEH